MDQDQEMSESGQPIYRHKPRDRGFELAIGDDASINAIDAHIKAHIGEVEMVLHEIISDLVHIDVHWIKPTPGRNYHTLITTGMSDRPMTVPEGTDVDRYAELMICLPPSWALSLDDFKDQQNYWPVRLLKMLSRLPHEYDTWLGFGHTVPNDDPPEPYAPGVGFCCALLLTPATTPSEFDRFEVSPGKVVRFLAVVPIYREEMQLKLKRGADALLSRFVKHDVSEVLEVGRRNAAARSLWPF